MNEVPDKGGSSDESDVVVNNGNNDSVKIKLKVKNNSMLDSDREEGPIINKRKKVKKKKPTYKKMGNNVYPSEIASDEGSDELESTESCQNKRINSRNLNERSSKFKNTDERDGKCIETDKYTLKKSNYGNRESTDSVIHMKNPENVSGEILNDRREYMQIEDEKDRDAAITRKAQQNIRKKIEKVSGTESEKHTLKNDKTENITKVVEYDNKISQNIQVEGENGVKNVVKESLVAYREKHESRDERKSSDQSVLTNNVQENGESTERFRIESTNDNYKGNTMEQGSRDDEGSRNLGTKKICDSIKDVHNNKSDGTNLNQSDSKLNSNYLDEMSKNKESEDPSRTDEKRERTKMSIHIIENETMKTPTKTKNRNGNGEKILKGALKRSDSTRDIEYETPRSELKENLHVTLTTQNGDKDTMSPIEVKTHARIPNSSDSKSGIMGDIDLILSGKRSASNNLFMDGSQMPDNTLLVGTVKTKNTNFSYKTKDYYYRLQESEYEPEIHNYNQIKAIIQAELPKGSTYGDKSACCLII